MNEIVNKSLLAGHKCMPEIHLKEPGFTYTQGPRATFFIKMQQKNVAL